MLSGGWSGVSWPSSLLGQGVCACMCVGTRPDKTVFPSSRKPHPQTTEGQVGPGVNKHPVKCNYAVRPPGRPGQLGLGCLSVCLSPPPHMHVHRTMHTHIDRHIGTETRTLGIGVPKKSHRRPGFTVSSRPRGSPPQRWTLLTLCGVSSGPQTASLPGRRYCHPHFIDEETDAQRFTAGL